MEKYIAYDAGSNIWEVELFDPSIDWHKEEYQGTLEECNEEAYRKMNSGQPHYPGAEYESIFDY